MFDAQKETQNTNELNLNEQTNEINVNETEFGKIQYAKTNKQDKKVKKDRILNFAKRLFFMFIAALIFNFGSIIFLKQSSTIPSGISGISLLMIILFPKTEPYYALMYLATNIPLLLGFGFKVRKKFIILTVSFMLFQILTNLVLTQPVILKFIRQTINISPGWSETIKVGDSLLENPNQWPVFLNGCIGAILLGSSIAISWKFGGSTGGTDIIAYYFSTKKQKSVSSVLSIAAFITSVIFLLIFGIVNPHHNYAEITYVPETVNENGVEITKYVQKIADSGKRVIIGIRELTTIAYIFVVNSIVAIAYPKYKKVSVEISCEDPNKVLSYFKCINYWHAYTLTQTVSGYSGKPRYKIQTTMLLLETRNLINDLKKIDPTLWISVAPVRGISGKFNSSFVEE